MNFTQPVMLWGMLAIAIPVFIHIWNKKKGIVIEWATTQWLLDKSQQQHRGIRLDNILLLILRCLLIILLAFLLSQPVIDLFSKSQSGKKVHLVAPVGNVIENYRFELEAALKNGEQLYWISSSPVNISSLSVLPEKQNTDVLLLQKSINNLAQNGEELNLYVTNTQELAAVPAIYVPEHFRVHAVVNPTTKATPDFKKMPDVHVLLDYSNPTERQTVRAALDALVSVYSFPLVIDFDKKTEKNYDWILTDKIQKNPSSKTLYVFSGSKHPAGTIPATNVVYAPESFEIQTSDIVSSGRLPEWLGEILIKHYKLEKNINPLNSKQLSSLFVNVEAFEDKSWERIQKCLIAAFVVLMIIERGIALNKMNV